MCLNVINSICSIGLYMRSLIYRPMGPDYIRFTEVMYADVNKRKPIIPLVLEHRYKPHGWLNFQIGDRLRYDFSRDDKFEESFPKLCVALLKLYDEQRQALG